MPNRSLSLRVAPEYSGPVEFGDPRAMIGGFDGDIDRAGE